MIPAVAANTDTIRPTINSHADMFAHIIAAVRQ
jgi:hypothetical protein